MLAVTNTAGREEDAEFLRIWLQPFAGAVPSPAGWKRLPDGRLAIIPTNPWYAYLWRAFVSRYPPPFRMAVVVVEQHVGGVEYPRPAQATPEVHEALPPPMPPPRPLPEPLVWSLPDGSDRTLEEARGFIRAAFAADRARAPAFVARNQEAALKRWDADLRRVAQPSKTARIRRALRAAREVARTTYVPLYNGVQDPDPDEVYVRRETARRRARRRAAGAARARGGA
jgi:hypothetical protein